MENKIKSKIIVPHIRGCSSNWSGILDGQYYGNFAANIKNKGRDHHLWYRVVCNNPGCDAIKAVHSSVLADV